MFYEAISDNALRCTLCAHRCRIFEDRRGICGVRENRGGTLVSLVYGRTVAEHVDFVEKKPLFHFLPGSRAYSIGTVGCNFHCSFCQNSDISQYPHNNHGEIAGYDRNPEQIVAAAKQARCQSIAYTYTEPSIFYEFALDTAILARKEGIKNIFVSNGYMSPEAADYASQYLDAVNIDLKAFTDDFYKKYCGGKLEPVLETIRLMKELGVWMEITTLIIPGLNDGNNELKEIARFIKGVGSEIPWHIIQFYPAYKMRDWPETQLSTLRRARDIGINEGLMYVYEGNVPGEGREQTKCHNCGALLIERFGAQLLKNRLQDGLCPDCGAAIDGVWL